MIMLHRENDTLGFNIIGGRPNQVMQKVTVGDFAPIYFYCTHCYLRVTFDESRYGICSSGRRTVHQ